MKKMLVAIVIICTIAVAIMIAVKMTATPDRSLTWHL